MLQSLSALHHFSTRKISPSIYKDNILTTQQSMVIYQLGAGRYFIDHRYRYSKLCLPIYICQYFNKVF